MSCKAKEEKQRLTSTIFVQDVDSKLEIIALTQFKRLAFCVFCTESFPVQECPVAGFEVSNKYLDETEEVHFER